MVAIRRAGGGADYVAYTDGVVPWHAAMAASYAHVTAPLRRLADRFVIAAVHATSRGERVPDHVEAAFAELPAVMDRAEARAGQVERAVIDLVEAAVLEGRVGSTFAAVVTDADDRGARVQLCDPAIVARITGVDVQPGDHITVRVDAADPETRTVELSQVL
jgi:exoribonuclease R